MPDAFDFRMHAPPAPLSRWIQTLWYARGTVEHPEHILPLSQIVLIINLGDPHRVVTQAGEHRLRDVWVVGQQTRPYLNDVLGETHAMGVVFEPDGARPFLQIPARELTDDVVLLDDFAGRWARELRERVLEPADPSEKFRALGAALLDRFAIDDRPERVRRTGHALRLLQSDTSVADVSARIGVSQKTMIGDFKTFVGLTPKQVERVQRFNRVLQSIRGGSPDWLEIAASCGYYDQSHLIRDFTRFAGASPTRYVQARREVYGETDDAPNFVPTEG